MSRAIITPQPGYLFASSEQYGEPPLGPHDADLSRIRSISVPEGADPADHVPAEARYVTRHLDGPGAAVVADRWDREPDRPCSTVDDSCSRLRRCLNGLGPCPGGVEAMTAAAALGAEGSDLAAMRLGMAVLE